MGVKGGGDVGADCGNSSGGSGASDNDYYRLYNGSSGRVTQYGGHLAVASMVVAVTVAVMWWCNHGNGGVMVLWSWQPWVVIVVVRHGNGGNSNRGDTMVMQWWYHGYSTCFKS